MDYFGKTKFPEASGMMGYWMHGNNIYDVSTSTHIKFLLEHLSDFGLTEEDVKKAYDETGEKYGTEGKARELLIKYAATHGWVRIRHYQRPRDFWSIQCENSNYQLDDLRKFCRWATDPERKLMAWDAEVTFMGYENPQDQKTFEWSDGGIGKFLEKAKATNKRRST